MLYRKNGGPMVRSFVLLLLGIALSAGSANAQTSGFAVVTSYGALCNGSTNDEAAFLSAFASNQIVIVPNTGASCLISDAGATWPNGLRRIFEPGASITVPSGSILTIKVTIDHETFGQIFKGTGVDTGKRWVRPEWCGAIGSGNCSKQRHASNSGRREFYRKLLWLGWRCSVECAWWWKDVLTKKHINFVANSNQ